MFCKVLRTYMGCEAGRVYDLDEPVAPAMVELKCAETISAGEFIESSRKSDNDDLRRSFAGELASLRELIEKGPARGQNPNPAPPSGGGGIDFDAIASGDDPAVKANRRMVERLEADKKRGIKGGLGEILHLVGVLAKPHLSRNPNALVMANRRLQHLCGTISEDVFDEGTGRWATKQVRSTSDGGFETITRTGTDSLSGGTTYGFALKPEFLGNLFEISMEQQVFVNAATQIPVSSGIEVRWPAWDQYQAPKTVNGIIQSAVFAGVSLYYEGEASPRVSTDAALNSINFKIVDLTAFTALSRDFVVDNYLAFDASLTRMIGRAFGWMEDYMSLQGPGTGRPQGIMNSGATLVLNRTDSSKIEAVDITGLIAKASPMVWDSLRWITNITCLPQLSILQDHAGLYVFQPNALITQAMTLSAMDKSVGGSGAELMHRPMGTLLGFPVYFTEKVPVLGSTGDLILCAPSQYGVARRSGLEIAVSEHFYFSTDLIAYRMKQRHDMKSLWRAPYQQADGSATQVSPFVMLH